MTNAPTTCRCCNHNYKYHSKFNLSCSLKNCDCPTYGHKHEYEEHFDGGLHCNTIECEEYLEWKVRYKNANK